jgi:hypothetical protein
MECAACQFQFSFISFWFQIINVWAVFSLQLWYCDMGRLTISSIPSLLCFYSFCIQSSYEHCSLVEWRILAVDCIITILPVHDLEVFRSCQHCHGGRLSSSFLLGRCYPFSGIQLRWSYEPSINMLVRLFSLIGPQVQGSTVANQCHGHLPFLVPKPDDVLFLQLPMLPTSACYSFFRLCWTEYCIRPDILRRVSTSRLLSNFRGLRWSNRGTAGLHWSGQRTATQHATYRYELTNKKTRGGPVDSLRSSVKGAHTVRTEIK